MIKTARASGIKSREVNSAPDHTDLGCRTGEEKRATHPARGIQSVEKKNARDPKNLPQFNKQREGNYRANVVPYKQNAGKEKKGTIAQLGIKQKGRAGTTRDQSRVGLRGNKVPSGKRDRINNQGPFCKKKKKEDPSKVRGVRIDQWTTSAKGKV